MDLATLIGQYCFPIVACCVMAYWVKYQAESNREDVKELRAEHSEEVDKLTEAINNNTLILNKLLTLLGKDGE